MATRQDDIIQIRDTDLGQMRMTFNAIGIRELVFIADTEPIQPTIPHEWWAVIDRIIAGQAPSRQVPLDLVGTPFQQQVWATLQTIPLGQTRSYSTVAELMGRASAVRAVARACADNPVSLLVPCHRVIGKSGKLTGYRWGLQRKQQLLQREGIYFDCSATASSFRRTIAKASLASA